MAQLFKALVDQIITYDEFLRCSSVVEKITNHDWTSFLNNTKKHMKVEDVGGLLSSGLFELWYDPVEVTIEEETDAKDLMEGADKYKATTSGGEMMVSVSQVGEIILEIFPSNYIKPKTIQF